MPRESPQPRDPKHATNTMAMVGKPELANHPSLPAIVDTAFVMTDEDESGDITLEEAAKTQEQISTMLGNFMAGELEGTEL